MKFIPIRQPMTSASATPTLITQRLQSIDALRGLVILFMLLDLSLIHI